MSSFLGGTNRICLATIAVLAMGVSNSANAAFVITFDTVYTGDAPNPPAPWLTATFEDNSDDNTIPVGQVLLTLAASLTGADEFITAIGFNFDGDATDLVATHLSGPTYDSFDVPGDPSLNGGGAPTFDFGFTFPQNNAPGTDRLNNSDVVEIMLSASTDINAEDFAVARNNPPSVLLFYAGAHVQGIDSREGSGKITGPGSGEIPGIPEPGSMTLLALGSIGLGGFLRRKMKKETVEG